MAAGHTGERAGDAGGGQGASTVSWWFLGPGSPTASRPSPAYVCAPLRHTTMRTCVRPPEILLSGRRCMEALSQPVARHLQERVALLCQCLFRGFRVAGFLKKAVGEHHLQERELAVLVPNRGFTAVWTEALLQLKKIKKAVEAVGERITRAALPSLRGLVVVCVRADSSDRITRHKAS